MYDKRNKTMYLGIQTICNEHEKKEYIKNDGITCLYIHY